MSFVIIITLPDGSQSGFGPFGKKRSDEIEQQLHDVGVYYEGPIDGPQFEVNTIAIEKWPGIRQFKRELEENQ